jgi:hypothetical protein
MQKREEIRRGMEVYKIYKEDRKLRILSNSSNLNRELCES